MLAFCVLADYSPVANPSSKPQDVGVFYAGQDYRTEAPRYRIERSDARVLLDADKAWSVNHGRDIALTQETIAEVSGSKDEREMIHTLATQLSQAMGPSVMSANADGQTWARRMTRAWNRRTAIAQHKASLRRYKAIAAAGAQ